MSVDFNGDEDTLTIVGNSPTSMGGAVKQPRFDDTAFKYIHLQMDVITLHLRMII